MEQSRFSAPQSKNTHFIEDSLPDTISPTAFPAKLWRIVNDPTNSAASWSSSGEAIVIDRQLFKRQVLYPRDTFKTTNFSSIIRQLSLYGFRKIIQPNTNPDAVNRHCLYYNPNFKQNHPELLANLTRLTVNNKVRLQGGLGVNVRQRGENRENILKRKSSSPQQPTSMSSTPSFGPSQVTDALSRTPVPPQYLRRDGAEAGSLVFVPAQQIPVPLSPQFLTPASKSNTMLNQTVLLTHANNGNPLFPRFAPWNAKYQPGYSPTVCHDFHLNLVPPIGTDLPTQLIPPQIYYQAGYPVNFLNFNQEKQHKENQDTKKADINIDTVFQKADELMLTSTSALPVKVEPIEVPVTTTKPGTCKVMPGENNDSSATASPASAVSAFSVW